MGWTQFSSILSNWLQQIYQIGETNLFGSFSINKFWFALAMFSVLSTSLIVFGRSSGIAASKVSSVKASKKANDDDSSISKK